GRPATMNAGARRLASLAIGLAWLAAVALSAAVGLRYDRVLARSLARVPYTATASTDAFFATINPRLTTRGVRAALAELPPGQAVVFVGVMGHPRASQDHYALSLVAL